jgi:hypothetical protein
LFHWLFNSSGSGLGQVVGSSEQGSELMGSIKVCNFFSSQKIYSFSQGSNALIFYLLKIIDKNEPKCWIRSNGTAN